MSNRVILHEDHVASIDFPNTVPGVDHSWNFPAFKESFDLVISEMTPEILTLDLIHLDASFTNALRRIILSEVPTLAIEHVFVLNNTGIMQDEVLAHRLGLVPIVADARMFEFKNGEEDPPTDLNTVVFKLQVRCKVNPECSAKSANPKDKYIDGHIYSSHLEWTPQGDQSTRFPQGIHPVSQSILLTKLRPGQHLDLELHCHKGIGKEHAKWSPVGTCFYRLLPSIKILSPITGPDAHKFKTCFSKGVVKVENVSGVDVAVVVNPRFDTVSRECLRHDEFKGKVELGRIRDHFIFQVESVGSMASEDIFIEAVGVLMEKIRGVREALNTMGLVAGEDVQM